MVLMRTGKEFEIDQPDGWRPTVDAEVAAEADTHLSVLNAAMDSAEVAVIPVDITSLETPVAPETT